MSPLVPPAVVAVYYSQEHPLREVRLPLTDPIPHSDLPRHCNVVKVESCNFKYNGDNGDNGDNLCWSSPPSHPPTVCVFISFICTILILICSSQSLSQHSAAVYMEHCAVGSLRDLLRVSKHPFTIEVWVHLSVCMHILDTLLMQMLTAVLPVSRVCGVCVCVGGGGGG